MPFVYNPTTYNKAEYEALIMVLDLAKAFRVESLVVQEYSQLIIGQVNGTSEAKKEWIKRYLSKVRQCIKGFTMAKFHQILRKENMKSDGLAKAASADKLVDD